MKFSDIIKKFNKKIDISYYLKSIVNLYIYFINYNDRYQLLFESLLKVLKKKDLDKDEISNMRDDLAQKSAEKQIKRYIKKLYNSLKKDKTIISYL